MVKYFSQAVDAIFHHALRICGIRVHVLHRNSKDCLSTNAKLLVPSFGTACKHVTSRNA